MGAESSCDSGGGCDYGAVNSRLSELYDQVTTSSKGSSSSNNSSSSGNFTSETSNFVSFIDTCEKMGVDTGLSEDTSYYDTYITNEDISMRLTELNKGTDLVVTKVTDIITKYSAGNPGSISVLTKLVNEKGWTSDKLCQIFDRLSSLRGNEIWLLYKDKCGEDINLTSNRLDEKFTENRLDELYTLVESETPAKKTLEEDFNVFDTEVLLKPNTFGILEDIIMEDEEQPKLTTEEFREYLSEFSYLSEQLEEPIEEPIEVSDIEKLIEEIKSSRKDTHTGLLLGKTFELLGNKLCSKYGSVVSSVCQNMGEDIGRDIGNMLDPIVQTFIKNFEKAKEEGKTNKDAILFAIQ